MAAGGLMTAGVSQAAGAAANSISGIISGVTGFFQKRQGKKLLANTPYPTYNIPNEVLQNQQVAQNMANEGLPSQQYQQGVKNIQRQQSAALSASADRKSGVESIGAIDQQTNDALGKLDVANAQARIANQRNLMNVNNQVAGYRDKAFNWNQKNKYLQNYNYAMGLIGAGNQNLVGGIDKYLTGGLKAAGMGGQGFNPQMMGGLY
jgi:hypothetical protein